MIYFKAVTKQNKGGLESVKKSIAELEKAKMPSKEELEHKEYMERKRLERQKEENKHKERIEGKLNFRMLATF